MLTRVNIEEGRQQKADNRRQTTEGRQQKADNRKQETESRQPKADNRKEATDINIKPEDALPSRHGLQNILRFF